MLIGSLPRKDLAPTPQISGLSLPGSGSLFFFYDADEQTWGVDPKDRRSAHVTYSPAPLMEQRQRVSQTVGFGTGTEPV